jgi:HPt (histidine-containing phosphotransfer) domain-containing protein
VTGLALPDDPDVRELLPAFLARRAREAEALAAAIAAGDAEAVRRIGHLLKGNGGSFGLPALSALGERLERAATAADGEAARQAHAELVATVAALTAACRAGDVGSATGPAGHP